MTEIFTISNFTPKFELRVHFGTTYEKFEGVFSWNLKKILKILVYKKILSLIWRNFSDKLLKFSVLMGKNLRNFDKILRVWGYWICVIFVKICSKIYQRLSSNFEDISKLTNKNFKTKLKEPYVHINSSSG